jgi:hypothetical protein
MKKLYKTRVEIYAEDRRHIVADSRKQAQKIAEGLAEELVDSINVPRDFKIEFTQIDLQKEPEAHEWYKNEQGHNLIFKWTYSNKFKGGAYLKGKYYDNHGNEIMTGGKNEVN